MNKETEAKADKLAKERGIDIIGIDGGGNYSVYTVLELLLEVDGLKKELEKLGDK